MDVVLVHGTTQSPAGWEPLAAALLDRGHRVHALDLPVDRPHWHGDDYAREAVRQLGGNLTDPMVVAHSGSGALLPALAAALGACRLVWLAASVPDPTGTRSLADDIQQSATAMMNAEWLAMREPPTVDPVAASYFLFHDCDLATVRWALGTLRLFHPLAVYAERPPPGGLGVPSRYVLPLRDRTLRPEWMRQAARERLGIEPIEIDAGHCPHVSQPRTLAAILDREDR